MVAWRKWWCVHSTEGGGRERCIMHMFIAGFVVQQWFSLTLDLEELWILH